MRFVERPQRRAGGSSGGPARGGATKRAQDIMVIATLHKGRMYDEIYCVAAGQAKRNQWIAVFRRMGVAIFDLQQGKADAVRVREH